MKCLLDSRDRRTVGICELMDWPTRRAGEAVEVWLAEDWAAQLAALMGVIGEGVRRATESGLSPE